MQSMSKDDEPTLQRVQTSVSTEPSLWDEVLEAYRAEQVAQSEYETEVCSVVLTHAPLDWEVLNPLLMRRRATHEAFGRAYRLWERSRAQRNGTAHPVANAAAPVILPRPQPGMPRMALRPAQRDSGEAAR
jgi:hypothetical protein